MLDNLWDELRGPDRRRASGRLELVLGSLQADSSVKADWGQVKAAAKEGRKMVSVAAASRGLALKDATATEKRFRAAEAELKALRDEQATRTRQQVEKEEEELKARVVALTDRDSELEQATQE